MERYNEYKDSGVQWLGEIPSHWAIMPLKYSGRFCKGKLPSETNENCLGKPIIGASEMNGNMPSVYSEDNSVPQCTKNDILFLWDGANAGLVSFFHEGIVASTVTKFTCDNSNIVSTYLYYLEKNYQRYYKERVGGTTIPHMNSQYIASCPLLIPSTQEQKAIADYLNTTTAKIDEAIAQQQKMIDLLNERKQIIINNAGTKGLNPDAPMKDSGVDWIGEIPEHWEVMKTSHIFHHIGSGTTPKSGREDYYSEDGIPFLQTGDLNDGFINETSKHITEKALRDTNLKLYPKGSLVVAMYGATIGKLGILNIDTTVNQACCVLPTSDRVGNKFAMHVLSTAKADLLLKSRGGGQPNISQDTIRNVKIVVPPLAEQNEIVQYIEHSCTPIDGAISNATKQISLLQERKQIIINDVVTGKVKVL